MAVVSACIATAVCVATVVATTRFGPDLRAPPERRLPASVAVLVLLGIALVVMSVWRFSVHRPRVATGLSVAAIATLVPLWSAWPWLGGGVRAAALALFPAGLIGMLLVVVGWSARPRGGALYRRAAMLLASGAAFTHVVGYDPFADLGCTRTCEHVEPALGSVLSTPSVIALASALTVAAAIVAIVAALRGRAARAPRPVVGAVVLALGGLAVGSAVRWATWGEPPAWRMALLLQPALVATVAGAATVVEGRSWRTRRAVDRLVARLSASEGSLPELGGGIRDVHFAVPGTDGWVDGAGADVGAPLHSKHVVLTHGDLPVLRLVLARGADEGDVIASLTQASRLALRNAQLSAVALARLSDVHASQRRVVAAIDAERRRIERDLHDGAQQRLIGVSFQLRIARARVDMATAPLLESAERRVRDALRRLRELAHGMFPRILVDEGLEAAVEELVSASPVATTLQVRLGEPVSAEVAMAAYATVVGALRQSRTTRGRQPARVSLERIVDELVVRVEIDGGNGSAVDWTETADRVGAAGGRFSVSTGPDRVSVSAVIPCGS